MKRFLLPFLFLSLFFNTLAQKPLNPSDVYSIHQVGSPDVSNDGRWVAYVVSTADSTTDKYNDDVWMAATDGAAVVQVTHSKEDENKPKWSPDNKWLAFISGREEAKEKSQLWIMDRRGGEAKQLTKLKVSISDFEWSPDSKKMVLVIRDQEIKPDSLEGRQTHRVDR